MKGTSNILLNFKLGCHKNNKNVKKISAMLKKYPKGNRGNPREIYFKGIKENLQKTAIQEETA